MRRLTTREVEVIRQAQVVQQGGRCAICQGPITPKPPFDAVLDHDHSSGAIRAVLHRSCNALLGKVENNAARFGVRDLAAFSHGVGKYLQIHRTNITGLLHPTHKTADEKRIAANKKRRTVRAKAKATPKG